MPSNLPLLSLHALWPDIVPLLMRPWESPAVVAHDILSVLRASSCWQQEALPQLEVIGSPEQVMLCVTTQEQVLFCNPPDARVHPLVQELREKHGIRFSEHRLPDDGTCLIAEHSAELKARLTLPSVLLVSLFHPEMYPASRLTLGIAYLAAYLRRHHLAKVELIDCQLGPDIADILARIPHVRPDVLGISVNFGQFDLMEQLLDSLYNRMQLDKPPVVVLGNILPAMCFREILKVYPQVVICRKEGELTLAALVKYAHDRSLWNQVPGIYYHDRQGRLVSTPPRYLPLTALPPPALDTVAELFAHDGVITAEFSRGCQYNRCSFCPRSHKGSIWRTASVASMLEQWDVFARVFQHFRRPAHVFLADEDFIGRDDGVETIERMTNFLDEAQKRALPITFDASCRADQIFREDRDQNWHLDRGRLFKHCVEHGLARLFVGVESGATEQLLRYSKGSSVQEILSAIRYLSLLGVQLRFGFIFFDPLMSVQDLIENIDFLGRTDVVLPTHETSSVEEIYTLVSSYHRQRIPAAGGRAVFEEVSYMVSPLEVLAKSRYLFDLREQAPQLMDEQIDVSFARYPTSYVLPEIGIICKACQYWVNYCFPIIYALKGLQKTSQGEEKTLLHRAISSHRYLGYMLIRGLAEIFSLVDADTLQRWEQMHFTPHGCKSIYVMAHHRVQAGQIEEAISSVLLWYEAQIRLIMEQTNAQLGTLSSAKQSVWQAAYSSWLAGSLSQTYARRIA